MIKKLLLSGIIFFIFSLSNAEAQVTAGIYKGTFYTQVGVGTNPENKYFMEGRLFAGDILNRFFGIEAIGQYNFIRSDWYNFSGGVMLGYNEFDDARIGLQSMVAIKPIEGHRNLALILEASPFINSSTDLSFRANFGIRYTFSRRE